MVSGLLAPHFSVVAGEAFQTAGNTFTLRRDHAPDYECLVARLMADRDLTAGLLIVCRLSPKRGDESELLTLRDMFFLCKALALRKVAADVVVMSRGVFAVLPDDECGQFQHACLAGFFASLRLEHPRIRASLVDADGVLPLATLAAEPAAGTQVAFRAGHRFERHMSVLPAPSQSHFNGNHRTWLFTGGTGGLGFQVASAIARKQGGRFALLGRSPRDHRIDTLLADLRASGAAAEYFAADVTEESSLAAALASVREVFGPLHGVFHGAGLLEDQLLTGKKWSASARVLAPKTYGTALLDRLTRTEPLAWFICCSSIVSLLGNPGQVDYAAANAFMDAYCHQRAASGAPGRSLSLNWSLWSDGGMGRQPEVRQAFAEKAGVLDNGAGLAAFFAALDAGAVQIAVTGHDRAFVHDDRSPLQARKADPTVQLLDLLAETLDVSSADLDVTTELADYGLDPVSLTRFHEKIADRFGIATLGRSGEMATIELLAQRLKDGRCDPATTGEAASAPIGAGDVVGYRATLMRILDQVLHLAPNELDLDTDLRDFGLDSVSLTELSEQIVAQTNVVFNAALLFQYPSVGKIAQYLARHPSARAANVTEKASIRIDPIAQPAATANHSVEPDGDEAIAIVGMSGRFPGSPDLSSFWRNLNQGHDLVSEVPLERWDWRAIYGDPTGNHNRTHCKWGGFLDDVRRFDAGFFNIPPSLAARMDPQQRILLEEVWHALEDACIVPSRLAGSDTGMFIGVSNDDYSELMIARGLRLDAHTTTGTYISMIPNRISYFLDIHGPSVAVNTACSSSLVAVYQAMRAILDGDCDMAVAGGINICLTPRLYFSLSHGGMLSPQGRCKTFDKSADGYVRGEGAGVVVLKKLSAARAAGDRILGVLRSGAVNHGGAANSLTAPNPNAQAELIAKAWRRAGVDPTTVSYIEAHGTGTGLGDPIEVNALKLAFEKLYANHDLPRPDQPHIALGSVKTNIGHLESAAGIAGLIKVLLAMRHRRLPGNIHLKEPNPLLELEGSPFHLLRESSQWNPLRPDVPLRAGISSFGFGGANAHLVVEEYRDTSRIEANETEPQLVVFSARDEARLREAATNLLDHSREHRELSLAQVAVTLQLGREAMACRLALVTTGMAELNSMLEDFLGGRPGTYHFGNQSKAAGTLLTGRAGEAFWKVVLEERDLERIACLWVAGAEVPWARLHPYGSPAKVALPGYPFERQAHWLPEGPVQIATPASLHPLIDVNRSTLARQVYEKRLDLEAFYLADHRVEGRPILPGAAYLEIARAAATLALEANIGELRNLVWLRPLMPATDGLDLRIVLEKRNGLIEFKVVSGSEEGEHARGELVAGTPANDIRTLDTAAIRRRCDQNLDEEGCYRRFASGNLDYGPAFRCVRKIFYNENESLAQVTLPQPLTNDLAAYGLHPSLLDGAFQSLIGLLGERKGTWVPFSLDLVKLRGPLPAELWVQARFSGSEASRASMPTFDLNLADGEGQVCVEITGFSLRAVEPEAVGQQVLPAKAPSASTVASGTFSRLVEDLVVLVSDLLGLPSDAIEPSAEMSDFGFDSITFTELANRINDAFGFDLTPAVLFDHGTLAALAQYLGGRFGDVLAAHYGRREAVTSAETIVGKQSPVGTPTIYEQPKMPIAEEPIAVIGMSAVLPGSPDYRAFWENLAAGADLISEVPIDRWDWRTHYGDPKQEGNRTNIRWGGFMSRVDTFDAAFFGISDLEAALMDPQQRIFLETAWKAVEDAGYRPSQLSGTRTGLFVGVATSDYLELLRDQPIEAHTATGWAHTILPNRLSYLWNLRGPSEPIDTACSSSLVALHRAISSIRAGECDQAIAGGVNVLASPLLFISFNKAGMLCEDGRCKTFDKQANGYVRGEGAGALLLKPLARALADGDPIHGLVRGSAVNHGGHANSLTAPNAPAQADVIERALLQADVDPATIGYIEAHGTGTALGDPIEINGLKQAFASLYQRRGQSMPQRPHCLVGSVKTNIGHLEAAAGIAGVIKVLLAMKHRRVPASLHLRELNPYIDLEGSPFAIASRQAAWPDLHEAGRPVLRAGVSSFGFGGVNAHLVLEAGPELPPAISTRVPRAFLLSARDEHRLQANARELRDFLDSQRVDHDALIHTLQVGREPMAARLAFVAHDQDEVLVKLGTWLEGNSGQNVFSGLLDRRYKKSLPTASTDVTAACRAWVEGREVDWAKVHGFSNEPRRICLPTYSFAPSRHWPTSRASRAGTVTPHHDHCYFTSAWVEATQKTLADPRGTVVLFDHDDARLEAVTRVLGQDNIVLAAPGTGFRQTGKSRFQLDPLSDEDYTALFHQIGGDITLLDFRLLVARRAEVGPDRELLEYACLIRGLQQSRPAARLQVVCTIGMQAGQAPPEQAALAALFPHPSQ